MNRRHLAIKLGSLFRTAGVVSMALGVFSASQVWAQSYPQKPIRFIVPLAAGSAVDLSLIHI